jgi:thiosulfate reductase cytochrome b subunit
MTQKLYIHPLPIRAWHWTNASLFIILILTGIQIRYIGQINLGLSFETAVRVHNYAGFGLLGAFAFWLLYHLFSDKMITRYHTVPSRAQFYKDSIDQVKYYGHGFLRGESNPQQLTALREFNTLQSLTYQFSLLLFLPLQFVTGFLLWDVKGFASAVDALGGVRVVDTVHVVLFIYFTAFLLAHAYIGSLGPKPITHFKEMVTGYDESDDPDHAADPEIGREHV